MITRVLVKWSAHEVPAAGDERGVAALRAGGIYARPLWLYRALSYLMSHVRGTSILTSPTCRYTVSRKDERTGQPIYGYLCGKPSAPNLGPGTPEQKAGACIDHLMGLHSPWAELRRVLRRSAYARPTPPTDSADTQQSNASAPHRTGTNE